MITAVFVSLTSPKNDFNINRPYFFLPPTGGCGADPERVHKDNLFQERTFDFSFYPKISAFFETPKCFIVWVGGWVGGWRFFFPSDCLHILVS